MGFRLKITLHFRRPFRLVSNVVAVVGRHRHTLMGHIGHPQHLLMQPFFNGVQFVVQLGDAVTGTPRFILRCLHSVT